jgi:hypothetical protein
MEIAQYTISEGMRFIQINKKAVENDVEIIIMGSKGNSLVNVNQNKGGS